jgi:8-amino-7-oxononanoate synthase
MNSIRDFIHSKTKQREQDGMLRSLKKTNPTLNDLSSNDYLGLKGSYEFSNFLKRKIQEFDDPISGSGGSRLLTGNYEYIEQLEEKIAKHFTSEAAIIFPSGYQANMGLLSCIFPRNFPVIFDEYCHASLKEGIRMSFARKISFRHNDMNHLEKILKKLNTPACIVTETVFSMDGDSPCLKTMNNLAQKYDSIIVADEAHACGIFGMNGKGLSVEFDRVFARTITFGKAYGVMGAAILCPKHVKEFLVNFSRPFIYSTAPSPLFCISIEAALDYTMLHREPLQALLENIKIIKSLFIKEFPQENCTNSAIQKIIIPGNEKVKKVALALENDGFAVLPVLYPTVPSNQERLRIVVHSFNTEEIFKNFFCSLKKLL